MPSLEPSGPSMGAQLQGAGSGPLTQRVVSRSDVYPVYPTVRFKSCCVDSRSPGCLHNRYWAVLVFYSCSNKGPHTWWLETTRSYLLSQQAAFFQGALGASLSHCVFRCLWAAHVPRLWPLRPPARLPALTSCLPLIRTRCLHRFRPRVLPLAKEFHT